MHAPFHHWTLGRRYTAVKSGAPVTEATASGRFWFSQTRKRLMLADVQAHFGLAKPFQRVLGENTG